MFLKNSSKRADLKSHRFLHAEKKYSNPFFENKKRKSSVVIRESVPLKIKFITGGLLLSFIFVIWFMLYSSYFTIKIIEARGDGRIDPMNIETYAWEQIKDSDFVFWPQKNLFVFDKTELIDTLNLKYSFNGLVVNKRLPNKILITFNEKEHSLVWLENDIYYYTDNHGYIIERIGDKSEDKNYPLIKNTSSFKIDSNKVSINQDLIDYVFLIIERIKPHSDIQIDHYIIEDNSTTVKAQLKNGPKLFFNIKVGIDRQLNKIVTLKKDILKDDFMKKEYIDVRTGDRVYYK